MIARHRGEFPVRLLCRVLEGSVAGFYAYCRRPESWRAVIDDLLMAHVRLAFAESGATYGAPRVHQELRAAGLPTSTKRVARLMREAGLAARPRTRGRVVTTDSQHGDPLAPNRLARQFAVHGVTLNQVWVGDISVPADAGRLPVSGDGAGSGLAALCRLGDARHDGNGARHECPADGTRRPAPGARLDLP